VWGVARISQAGNTARSRRRRAAVMGRGLSSGRPVQQGDVMPQRQCGLPAVRRRGGRRRDATTSHRGLNGTPWHGAWPEFHRRAAR
jgi:hypothetical protein